MLRTPVLELHGVRLRLCRAISSPISAELLDGRYESPERQALEGVLRPNDVVLELGAGLGFLSTFCAKRVGSANVHAFEANPALEPLIRDTFALNGVAPQLSVGMLGAVAGTRTLYVKRNFWGSSTVRPTRGRFREVQVRVHGYADVLANVAPTVLVIDIEGGELELLELMTLARVRVLVMEVHLREIRAEGILRLRELLGNQGFAVKSNPDAPDLWVCERQGRD